MIKTIIGWINTYLDRYEAAMNEWHEADPEGYYAYIAGNR